ncbi:MAG: DUF4314 domain-containing protein [Clostridia bacterium]|nr:DUF4314 domain-containing protein [Clostridia bacterium]
MSSFENMSRYAERMQKQYPEGTRLLLNSMNDPYAPVPPGTRGTVNFVDDAGQIHMKWDNGRTLAIVPSEDDFRKLTDEELAEESEIEEESENFEQTM